jgi:thiamine-phosphate pyrophosphorylase
MKRLADCLLYGFVDWAWLDAREPVSVAEDLVKGGVDILQLRAKAMEPELLLPVARRIARVTKEAGVNLVINDHLRLAQEIGAEFCHLGQEDFFDKGHQRIADLKPGGVQIGLSTHNPAQASSSISAGPAYIAIGPVYATTTKPQMNPVTLNYVRWAADNVKIPWFAIGGITLENLQFVLDAGARRVCVVSAILKSADVVRTCQEFKKALTSAANKK